MAADRDIEQRLERIEEQNAEILRLLRVDQAEPATIPRRDSERRAAALARKAHYRKLRQ